MNDERISTAQTDHELMQRVARGERDALAVLVQRHQSRVLSLAYRFLGHWDAAEDVCQDTFLRVFHNAAAYRPDAQFTTWLYRIVANQCWDHRRKAAREPVPQSNPIDPVDPAGNAAMLERKERQDAIRLAVARLPDRQRLALVLHRFEGMSHAQIAEATGWSAGAVESCIVRAYATLRERLADLRND
ncbi:MAG: sigma-70 family RNA polymerase sigma factor [Phycisphaerales bacterium]|nr:sigma-70 family RNA polymerase sigma factor [Phycisphaerales bacterium]MCB9857222.1 sigma-70 family RNA polymerase sigma factor [Phycisphaerales bacterium]MCB9863064.1 sigma-70 family RNA polymerase sigma factor [Phycisphaerales bacterium]